MFYLFWLWQLIRDERGEDDPEPTPEPQPEPEPEPEPEPGPTPEPEPEPTPPKYGDLGDNPTVDEIFAALNNEKTANKDFRTKAGLTEKNLGKLRQTLDTAGIVMGEDGKLRVKEGMGKKAERRFTDTHKALFDSKVLEAIQFLMDDAFDARFSSYDKRAASTKQWETSLTASIAKMNKLYPAIQKEIGDKPNPTFNQALYDRAEQLLNDPNTGYIKLANGDLLAAHEAAMELGISPIAVEKAKKAGFKAGAGAKRVLGPTKPSGQQKVGTGKLTKTEYLALPPEEKEKYDKSYVLKE